MNMTAIKETSTKIDKLVSSCQEAEKIIIIGSDEHLDIILDTQSALKKIIKLSVIVNEALESSFNQLSVDEAKRIVIKLNEGLSASKQLINALINSHSSISNGVKTLIDDLQIENDGIDEFIQDLINYKINSPKELVELLKSISEK
jgi:phosphoribosylaminoimidazole-succinocarboxamide synthase